MSDTPKTDALREVVIGQYKEDELTGNGMGNLLAALTDIETLERERDEAREERDQYRSLLIRLHNDLFVHHGGQAVREFKELFREENYN